MENIKFIDLDISPELKKAVKDMGFEEATPVQSQSILPIIEGNDVVAQAPTGTGKTCAFGIPLIEKIDGSDSSIQGLILCPTRELVIQTTDELLKLAKFKKNIKITPIYGGQQIDRQIFALKKNPQVIVATPGRLMDHMRRRTIRLDDLRYLVLDEADEMLNMGFREDIDTILESVSTQRQTVLFSATLSPAILEITKKYLRDEIVIKVTHKQITVPTVEQFYLETKSSNKINVLTRLIDVKNYHLVMVFCNTKRMVDELTGELNARGYTAEGLHGDMKQAQRDRVMSRFKKGLADILVATDVAARGIDVDNIEAVFNYDLPSDNEYYVHRIGRTGRANRTGAAYTFIQHRELYQLRELMRYTKSVIKPMAVPSSSEIQDIKTARIARELFDLIRSSTHQRYIEAIEKMLEEEETEATTLDIAAAFLSREFSAEEQADRQFQQERDDRGSRNDRGDRRRASGDNVRLFLNIGSLDKIKPRHMIELFKMMTSVDIRELNEISIFDKYSFVTVPAASADSAVLALNGIEYKGRVIAAEIANAKTDKKQGAHSRSDRGYSNRGQKAGYHKRRR